MGTSKRAAAVKCFLSLIMFAVSGVAFADPGATDKVIQFLTNAYTGQAMHATAWLRQTARHADKLKAFGGLDRLVKQSTARAHQYQGLRSVSIRDVKEEAEGYLVTAEVKFMEDHRNTESPAVAEREDVIWMIRAVKENGRWTLVL